MKKLMMVAAALTLALPSAHAAEEAQGGGRMFAKMDANGDGKLDKAEITKMLEARAARKGDATIASPEKVDGFIKRADSNGDGVVDAAEMAAMRAARTAKATAEN